MIEYLDAAGLGLATRPAECALRSFVKRQSYLETSGNTDALEVFVPIGRPGGSLTLCRSVWGARFVERLAH